MLGGQVATKDARPQARTESREATEPSSRILRVTLAIDDARAYWEHADPTLTPAERPLRAFEERWFGAKSLERIRSLLSTFAQRFDAFSSALTVLHRWRTMDMSTRQILCHFHVQLSDVMYRKFTGSFLVERRGGRDPKVDRDAVLRWVRATYPNRWADATCVQFASKLLSAASEAGLVSPKRDPRTLHFPKVTDLALAYMLYLLRETKLEGSLLDNPYFASVGLTGSFLDQRLRSLPGLTFHRMANLTEFDWAFPDLLAWAEGTL